MKTQIKIITLVGLMVTATSQSFAGTYSHDNEHSLIKELAQIINFEQSQDDISYRLGRTEVNDSCETFMSEDLDLGKVGEFISNEVQDNKNNYRNLINSPVIAGACKNYKNLSLEDKSMVITLLLTTMAHFESSCQSQTAARGPNGTAKGYFQLHQGRENRYADSSFCPRGSSANPLLASRCTLKMLDNQLANKNALFTNSSYWDVLRPGGHAQLSQRRIQSALSNISLCQL